MNLFLLHQLFNRCFDYCIQLGAVKLILDACNPIHFLKLTAEVGLGIELCVIMVRVGGLSGRCWFIFNFIFIFLNWNDFWMNLLRGKLVCLSIFEDQICLRMLNYQSVVVLLLLHSLLERTLLHLHIIWFPASGFACYITFHWRISWYLWII